MPTVGITTRLGGGQVVARGLNPAKPISGGDMAALLRLLGEKVRDSVRLRSVDPLMGFVYSSLTEGAEYVAHLPLACAKGCSFCCHLWVDASPPEILYTVKTIPAADRQRALEAVERACGITSKATFLDRCGSVNPPCPLLGEGGACSVYDNRPISCRTTVSVDADLCRQTLQEGSEAGFPGLKVWLTLRDSYATALEGALMQAGLAYQAHEWNQSLQIAMTEIDAEKRWLAGADVFADAPVSPAPSAFDNPMWRAIYQQAFGAPPP